VKIEASSVIERPPGDVWALIADLRNDPRWCDKVVSVDQVTGDRPGSGARYDVLHRPIRVRPPKKLVVTVADFEPPRRMRIREEDDDAVFEVTYELAEAPAGTKLTQIDEIDWKIPFPGPQIGRAMVRRDIRRQLRALKSLLE
jgi:uncharacterized protein YndB with AHSA1/START domain